jgi:hypothetical protein
LQQLRDDLLQWACSDDQIGPFENLHHLVRNAPLAVLRAGLKVILQYALRVADGLKNQLLIGQGFSPKKMTDC